MTSFLDAAAAARASAAQQSAAPGEADNTGRVSPPPVVDESVEKPVKQRHSEHGVGLGKSLTRLAHPMTRIPGTASAADVFCITNEPDKAEADVIKIQDNCDAHRCNCEKIEAALQNPNETLQASLDEKVQQFRYVHFFAWAAMHNKAELLDNPYYQKILKADARGALESLKVAILFDATDYVAKIFEHTLLSDLAQACFEQYHLDVNDFLLTLVQTAARYGKVDSLKLFYESCSTPDDTVHFFDQELQGRSPLFHAVRYAHVDAVEYLLSTKCGVTTCRMSFGETYLHCSRRLPQTPEMTQIIALLEAAQ